MSEDLLQRIEELEQKIQRMEEHRHLGLDNSRELDDNTRIGCKEISVSGVGIQRNLFAIPFFRAYDIDEPGKDRRKMAMAIGVSGEKDTRSEQDTMVFQIGKGEVKQESSKEDWENNSFSQILMTHRPKGSPAYIPWLGKNLTVATFLNAKRSPIVFGDGTIVGKTLTDPEANFQPGLSPSLGGVGDLSNTVVHGICNAKDENLNILESNVILEVTKNSLICENEWNVQGAVNYEILMPVVLGAANVPFSLGYFGDGLVFGYGTRARNNISSLTFGEGTPEGKITANVGSIYLRQDGGAGTTFYVKETGKNTNSGWVAK